MNEKIISLGHFFVPNSGATPKPVNAKQGAEIMEKNRYTR